MLVYLHETYLYIRAKYQVFWIADIVCSYRPSTSVLHCSPAGAQTSTLYLHIWGASDLLTYLSQYITLCLRLSR